RRQFQDPAGIHHADEVRALYWSGHARPLKTLGSDVLSIRREAVEQTSAPGRLQLLLTAATRAMRGIPGPHMPSVFQPKAVMMTHERRTVSTFGRFPQVLSPPAVENLPDGSEPVRMSCMFTASPRPLTVSPFSVSAVCFVILTASECRSSTFFATITPFALYQGPLPIRSRAFTPASPPGSAVLRY